MCVVDKSYLILGVSAAGDELCLDVLVNGKCTVIFRGVCVAKHNLCRTRIAFVYIKYVPYTVVYLAALIVLSFGIEYPSVQRNFGHEGTDG